jgi:hypothetical protein
LLIIGTMALVPKSVLSWTGESTCADTAKVSSAVRRLSPMNVAQLLQKPNGLETAARLTGHFSANADSLPINQFDLDGLVAKSSLIVAGTVQGKKSVLIDDGDDIFTKYTMLTDTPLKGSAGLGSAEVVFTVKGGCVTFADGTSAEISTHAWRYIEVGKQYLVFLYLYRPSEFGYSITGGIEGLGKIVSADGRFELIADSDRETHHLVSDRAKGMTTADLLSKIKLKN